MPNNCLSVLYKRIIQVENKNVGLKVGGGGGWHKHTIAPPPNQKSGGHMPPLPPPPPPHVSYASDIYYFSVRFEFVMKVIAALVLIDVKVHVEPFIHSNGYSVESRNKTNN